jgi:hypothetical protein
MSVEASDLAFGHGMGANPDKIWRVVWWRVWGKHNERRLRCTDYFGEEQIAWDFVGLKTEAGYEVASVDAFVLVRVEGKRQVCNECRGK